MQVKRLEWVEPISRLWSLFLKTTSGYNVPRLNSPSFPYFSTKKQKIRAVNLDLWLLGVSFKCLLFEKEFSASFSREKFESFRNMLKDTKMVENWKGGSSLFFINLFLTVKENSDGIQIWIRSAAHKIELHTPTPWPQSAARLMLVCFVLTVKKLLDKPAQTNLPIPRENGSCFKQAGLWSIRRRPD